MKILEPHQGILNYIISNAIGISVIEVYGQSPGRFIFFRKVRCIFCQVIPFRPQMIIKDTVLVMIAILRDHRCYNYGAVIAWRGGFPLLSVFSIMATKDVYVPYSLIL